MVAEYVKEEFKHIHKDSYAQGFQFYSRLFTNQTQEQLKSGEKS